MPPMRLAKAAFAALLAHAATLTPRDVPAPGTGGSGQPRVAILVAAVDPQARLELGRLDRLAEAATEESGRVEIDRLVPLAPELKFTSQYFPPDAIAHAEAVRKQATAGRGILEVKSTPPGAELFVDGQYKGLTPMKLDDVPVAQHWIDVLMPGYA